MNGQALIDIARTLVGTGSDETIRQDKEDGTSFLECLKGAGIVAGIKVDMGAKELAGYPEEKVTGGLDGLRDRLEKYLRMGARFAKWRAVIALDDHRPSRDCIEANAHALAHYAALCQEAGLVPVVEPEVLMDGDHTMERCREVTVQCLQMVFEQLRSQRKQSQRSAAQQALLHRAHCNRAAIRGEYTVEMERS